MNVKWKDIDKGCKDLYKKIPKNKYDGVICIATGGLIPGKIISEMMVLPLGIVVSKRYNDIKKKPEEEKWIVNTNILWNRIPEKIETILLVDDIIDEGKTMHRIISKLKDYTNIKNIDISVLYYKPKNVVMDLNKYKIYKWKTTKDWIKFPWER